MMKVLVLAPRPLWPAHDGGTVASVHCVSGLAAAGAEVTALSMVTEKHMTSGIYACGAKPDYLTDYITVQVNTAIRPLPMILNLFFSGEPYDLARFRSGEYSKALRRILTGNQFDIIHCEGLPLVLYLNGIRSLTTTPVVLRAHNLEHTIREMMAATACCPLSKYYLSLLSRRLKKTEAKTARQFDAVVPISEPDAAWFRSISGDKPVFLAEAGTDEALMLPEPSQENPRVGFIGAMNWQPNADAIKWFISEVWSGVIRRIPSATLHIAGRGLRQTDVLPPGPNIINVGEPDNAREFIASNHVMIAPLFAGSGIRIKIIEAMSAGRPVVATPVAVAGLPVENGRELAVASDPATFTAAIVRLLEEPELRASTGERALRLVKERYDNTVITARLLEFYKKLRHGS
ncbi:MAG TPA: glycosyltransferase [Bacteroidales bacterium]|nr:glycosyltransferase [Bacteroidales bacterium]